MFPGTPASIAFSNFSGTDIKEINTPSTQGSLLFKTSLTPLKNPS